MIIGTIHLGFIAVAPLASLSLDFKGSIFLIIGLIALSLAWAIFAYRRTLPPVGLPLRILLGFLRAAALLLLIFLIFEPSLSFRRERQLKPLLAVIFDDSQSLLNKDASGPRSQQLFGLMNDAAWADLRRNFDLDVFAAGDSLREMGAISFDSLHLKTIGTDLAGFWEKAVQREEGQDLAGLVLVSDGGDNAGRDPVKAASSSKIPIYCLGVGDTSEVRDASITSLVSDEVAYRGKETQLSARVKARGLAGETATLELTDGDGRNLAKQFVKLPPDGLEAEVVLKLTPDRVGLLPLNLRLLTSTKEWSDENNRRSLPLVVKESRIRVLVVSGLPSFESMFLQRGIAHLSDFELRAITLRQNGETFGQKSEALGEAMTKADVLVLMNLLPLDNAAARERLRRAHVQHPLPTWIWLGAKPSAQAAKELLDETPFSLTPAPSAGAALASPIRLYAELDPDAESSEAGQWNDLPPLESPQVSAKLSAAVQTLIALKDVETGADLGPALATWESGERRFATSFGSGYWRWGFLSVGLGNSDELYQNHLGRVLRWLAASPKSRRLRLTLDRNLCAAGETVHFDARVLGGDERPVSTAQVEIVIEGPEGSSKVLMENDPTGRYRGAFTPEAVGTYSYRGFAQVGADTLGADSGSFMVEAYNVEKETLNQNRALLEAITKASGGVYLPADSLAKLAGSISATPRQVTVGWKRRFFLNWDVWAILIGLLALEWIIRKRRGML